MRFLVVRIDYGTTTKGQRLLSLLTQLGELLSIERSRSTIVRFIACIGPIELSWIASDLRTELQCSATVVELTGF